MKRLFVAVLVCFSLTQTAFALVAFGTRRLDVSPNGTAVQVAIGDVDGDGANELVVLNDGPLQIFSISKAGEATLKASVPITALPGAGWSYAQPRIVDADNDGDRDIAIYARADGQSGQLQIVRRDGNGFSVDGPYTTPESDAAYNFDMADIDGDGYADAITANHGMNAPQALFVTSGASGFTSSVSYPWSFNGTPDSFGPSARGIVHVYARDLDADGRIDVVVSTVPYNTVAARVFFNKPGLGLTTTQDLIGRASIDVGIGDFNNDGRADIVTNGDHAFDIKAYRGPQFTTISTFRIPPDPRSITVADFSGDGKPDIAMAVTSLKNVNIVVAGSQGSTAVNSADLDAADFMPDAYVQELAAGDIDNDGDLDLVLSTDRVIWIRALSSDTTPPVLTLPTGITVAATSAAGANVTWTAFAVDAVDGGVSVQCTPASGSLFAIGTTVVNCSAKDLSNNTATGKFNVTVTGDVTPPVLTLPSPIVLEATSANGAIATWTASALDAKDGAVAVQCTPASGSTFALGTNNVSCSASDAAGNTANGSFTVTVRDTTAPVLTLPSPIVLEATSANGAMATWTTSATDIKDGAVTVQCTPASGSTFALGINNVSCSATDAAGNAANGSFTVTVRDTTAPVLTLPSPIVLEATSANGAVATWTASATDVKDGAVTVQCTPPSGSTFALGTNNVSCSATDAAGNSATGSFSVTVRDTTAPVLTLPSPIVLEATSANGAVATWTASATDVKDGAVTVQCTPASGSTFALGTNNVSCSATDAAGNAAKGSFTVTVRDTTAPVLTLPSPIVLEATSANGAVATWTASALDAKDGAVTVQCTPPSGSLFALGTNNVSCSAKDAAGNTASGSFTVTVGDTKAPVLTLPSPIVLEATSPNGAVATWTASALDAKDGAVAVQCTPPSGSTFALGISNVSCSAKDAAGNTANGSFTVTVRDTKAPVLTLPTPIVLEATSTSGAVATWTASAIDIKDGAVPVQCTPASGSMFALGIRTVSCSAKDAAGNAANGSFTVTVRDTKAPVLTLPAPIVLEATSASGAVATWSASAIDIKDGVVAVQCTPASGSLFAIGMRTVSCSAKDSSGNAASGSFSVTVRDTTAPKVVSITASPNVLRTPNHKMQDVAISLATTDAGDVKPIARIISVTSSEPVQGLGDGDTAPDWAITGALTLQLRAERSGTGNGRVYTITVAVADRFSNTTLATVTVTVPK
ncbi:MAG TPA: HYR domain-containing protein [Thermoanaerobaculia bacterium]|nr:HYR domain-containing protein [Thermoanaerobaculia bacterium]